MPELATYPLHFRSVWAERCRRARCDREGRLHAAKTLRRSIAPPLGPETPTVPELAGAPAPAPTVPASATGAAAIVDWPAPAPPGTGPGLPGPGAAAPCPVPTPPGWAP